jgi:hypothetical protein
MSRRVVAALLAGLVLSAAAPVSAQTSGQVAAPPLLAGATYDPAVPTLQGVLGWASGDQISRPEELRRYFEALAAHAPDRVRLFEYGRTHEGRPLWGAVVASPANLARLEAIRAGSRALSDPRATSAAEAERLIADLPAIVWLAHSVHGDEISPADAAAAAAHHLLASRDPAVRSWLDRTVVVFVPSQNPDGRNRFINSFRAGLGVEPNPDPLSAERAQPWPGGRFNHDLFDLNRDWFIQSQPETQGHAALVLDWRPHVLVDAHEMGTDESFFFPPEADPLNPLLPQATLAMRETIGRNTARRFDEIGQPYFVRQIFDAFYPGYGDGWPAYLGAVSMTYEQGSARGLVGRRSDGSLLTYRESVRNTLVALLSTIEASAANRERLLRDRWAFARDGVEGGRGAYILGPNPADPTAVDKLAGLLVRSGIEVGRADRPFNACGRQWPAGSYVVSRSQPLRRMAEVLLTRDIPVPEDFMALQAARRDRGLGDQLYDVTAWSLPLMFNVPAEACGAAPQVATTAVGPELVRPAAVANPEARYGWLIHPGAAGQKLTIALLRQGVAARALIAPFTHESGAWPAGTVLVPRAGQPADLPQRLQALAATTGARVVGVDGSWTTSGISFGSAEALGLTLPNVLLAWDEPTDPTAAGAARHILEREFGLPVTAARTARLAGADLNRYPVIVLPDGGDYAGRLGERGVANLRAWVERGGTLVALGAGAAAFVADADHKLGAVRLETDPEGEAASTERTLFTTEVELRAAVLGTERPTSVAGALVRARVDADHWLAAGVAPELILLAQGDATYAPLSPDAGANVVSYLGPDQLRASGQLWDETRRALAFKPAVMVTPVGRGQVVVFTQDPTTRAYLDGLKPLFLNALLLGPAVSGASWVQ